MAEGGIGIMNGQEKPYTVNKLPSLKRQHGDCRHHTKYPVLLVTLPNLEKFDINAVK